MKTRLSTRFSSVVTVVIVDASFEHRNGFACFFSFFILVQQQVSCPASEASRLHRQNINKNRFIDGNCYFINRFVVNVSRKDGASVPKLLSNYCDLDSELLNSRIFCELHFNRVASLITPYWEYQYSPILSKLPTCNLNSQGPNRLQTVI